MICIKINFPYFYESDLYQIRNIFYFDLKNVNFISFSEHYLSFTAVCCNCKESFHNLRESQIKIHEILWKILWLKSRQLVIFIHFLYKIDVFLTFPKFFHHLLYSKYCMCKQWHDLFCGVIRHTMLCKSQI